LTERWASAGAAFGDPLDAFVGHIFISSIELS